MGKTKHILGILTGILLVLCLAAAGLQAPAPLPARQFSFRIGIRGEVIRSHTGEDGRHYVFLPGYAQPEQVQYLSEDTALSVGGKVLHPGDTCAGLVPDREYPLEWETEGIRRQGSILFLHTGPLPTLYLDTASGSMEYIHLEKTNEEAGSLRLYDEQGEALCTGDLTVLKGRGNTSWGADKKPYNLTLREEADLLGMGSARNWVLLAEGYNTINVRNKLVCDFAAMAGLPYVPDCRWVDLYLNGEYAGLYLLSERNEIHPRRVDLQPEGTILVSQEYESRLREQKLPYVCTDSGQALRIRHGAEDPRRIRRLWQSAENAILAPDGVDIVTGKHWSGLIDLDSWAEKYLLEELFGNLDAGSLSQYYYVDGADPREVIHAGPVWDYDFAMGGEDVWLRPYTDYYVMNRQWVNDSVYTPWYPALYRQPLFLDRVKELFADTFLPALEVLLEKLPEYAALVRQSAVCDCFRWGIAPEEALGEWDYIAAFLKGRSGFLWNLWMEESVYHTVTVDPGRYGLYGCFAVKDGGQLPRLPEPEAVNGLGWIDADTGEPFDVTAPVREDARICIRKPDAPLPGIHYVPAAVLAAALCAWFLLDRYRRKKNGRPRYDPVKANEIPS